MKKLLTLAVALLTAAALFISCSPSSGDNSEDDSSGTSSSGSGSGGSGGDSGSTGSGQTSTSAISYIFDKSSLTVDCSENVFDDFLDATGTYKFQIVYSLNEGTAAGITYSYKGQYKINDGTAGEQEFSELIETLYAKNPGLSDSTAQQAIKEIYEAQGFTVTINGDTAICVNSDAIDNPSSAVPEISHNLYSIKKTCKIDKATNPTKLYITVEGVLGNEIMYYLQKIN